LALESRAQKERVVWQGAGGVLWLRQSDENRNYFLKNVKTQITNDK
jgi:hypothetical protein